MNESVLDGDIYQQDFDKLQDFLSLSGKGKKIAAKILNWYKWYQLLRYLAIFLFKVFKHYYHCADLQRNCDFNMTKIL